MAGIGNKGKLNILDVYFRAQNTPANFFIALVEQTGADSLNGGGAAVDKATFPETVGIPITAHAFSAGQNIRLIGTDNYDGEHVIVSQTANEIVITAQYIAENFASSDDIHVAPGPDTNTLADLTEVGVGNGYSTGGDSVARNSTDWDIITEVDANDYALVQLKDWVFTASGGNLPSSGLGAAYAVILGPHATPASREVLGWGWLGGDRTVSDTQTLTIQNQEFRLTE